MNLKEIFHQSHDSSCYIWTGGLWNQTCMNLIVHLLTLLSRCRDLRVSNRAVS